MSFLLVEPIDATAFSVEEASIESVHEAMRAHHLSCQQLVQDYLDRIKAYDLSATESAPLNAISSINPYVIAQAQQLDAYYTKTHQFIGPMHCIPIILKDNIDSFDTLSSEGSYALLGNHPNKDAFLTARLRQAGALILAKGSMDEFASGMSGISSLTGRTGNAYDPNQNPGGSSSGPAVAVSANFAMVGIGTDNSGSIRIPAGFNGLIGLRPTAGLISQNGLFPVGNMDGVAGPLTRTVEDLAIVMDVIATKADPQDPKTQTVARIKSYTSLLSKDALQHKRIGIVHLVNGYDVYQGMTKPVKDTIQQAEKLLQRAGAILIDPVNLPKFNNDRQLNMAGSVEAANQYLNSFPAVRKDMNDICLSDRTRTYGKTSQQCLKFLEKIAKQNSNEYKKALQNILQNKRYVEEVMRQQHLDALLIPLSRSGYTTYDPFQVNTWQAPVASNTGLPAIVVNAGYVDHLPIGIELIGQSFDDGQLIAMAYAYEKTTEPRLVPTMPRVNDTLKDYSIVQLNNLFPLLGKTAYDQVLKNKEKEALTANVFQTITQQVVEQQ